MEKIDIKAIKDISVTSIDLKDKMRDSEKNPLNRGYSTTRVLGANSLISRNIKIERLYQISDSLIDSELLDDMYHGRPSLWCIEKYGTTGMLPYILKINDISSPLEFTMKKVRFLSKEGVYALLGL